MQDELAVILGRPVDLVTRSGLEQSANAVRKREILDSAQVVYAA
jgi:predicted nucleotidyltransferase